MDSSDNDDNDALPIPGAKLPLPHALNKLHKLRHKKIA